MFATRCLTPVLVSLSLGSSIELVSGATDDVDAVVLAEVVPELVAEVVADVVGVVVDDMVTLVVTEAEDGAALLVVGALVIAASEVLAVGLGVVVEVRGATVGSAVGQPVGAGAGVGVVDGDPEGPTRVVSGHWSS